MEDIFFNQYGRLRSGWRFFFFVVAFLFLGTFFARIASVVLSVSPIGFEEISLLSRTLESTIGLIVAIFLGWLCNKFFEGLPFRALGTWFTKYWFKDLILGCLIGFATVSFAVLLAIPFSRLRFEFNVADGIAAIEVSLLVSLVIFILGAAFEEVLIRGYIFQTLVRAQHMWLAIIATSMIFTSLHLDNPNAELISTINTFLAGVWLGVAYLKTRTLWLAFGLHFAWNWFQGSFYGIEVSGITELTPAPLLTEIDAGPTWITGGDYGLEGGIACTLALIVSTTLIWYLPVLKATDEMTEFTSKETPLAKDTLENV